MSQQQIPREIKYKINSEIERLSKLSTAPYKETPDWMERDLRNGLIAGYSINADQLRKKEHEIARLRNALDIILNMKVLPEEKDYRFAFNRCWHAANDALSSLPVKQEEDREEKIIEQIENKLHVEINQPSGSAVWNYIKSKYIIHSK